MTKFFGKILAIRDEVEGVKTFRIQTPCGFEYQAGQFVLLSFKKGDAVIGPKPFTISNYGQEQIECTIKKAGPFTSELFLLSEGDMLEVSGPFGTVVVDSKSEKDIVVVTIGVAITPFKAIIEYLIKEGSKRKMLLFYGNYDEKHVIFRQWLEEKAKQNANLEINYYLSDETNKELFAGHNLEGEGHISFHEGRIPLNKLANIVEKQSINGNSVAEKDWFVCGSEIFKKSTKEELVKQGIDEKDIVVF